MYIIKPVPFSLLSVSEPENDAPVWSIGTTYPLGGTVIRNGAVFVSSIAGNLGLDPDNEPQELVGARWLRKSVTNIRKFFDGKLSTKTVGTSPLVIEVTLNANFNSVALLELTSSETLVEMIFGGVTTVLGTIVSGAEPVNNWWKWLNTTFFSSSHRVVLPDASGFSGAVIRLTITGPNPSIGELVVGRSVRIGTTTLNSGTKMRNRTFSTNTTNQFGDTTVVKRVRARDVTYSVVAMRDGFDSVAKFLDEIDGVAVVSYADADWEQFTNYGTIIDWELPANMPNQFKFAITTQGVS